MLGIRRIGIRGYRGLRGGNRDDGRSLLGSIYYRRLGTTSLVRGGGAEGGERIGRVWGER